MVEFRSLDSSGDKDVAAAHQAQIITSRAEDRERDLRRRAREAQGDLTDKPQLVRARSRRHEAEVKSLAIGLPGAVVLLNALRDFFEIAAREHTCSKGLGLRARHENLFGTFCKLLPTVYPTALIWYRPGIGVLGGRSHDRCGDIEAVRRKKARIGNMYKVGRLELEEIIDE